MKKCLFALIPFVISLILLISGITNISKSRDVIVPEMGDPNWFEMETKQTELKMSGIAMTIFGFMLLLMAVVILISIIAEVKHKDKTMSQLSELMKKDLEEEKEEQNPQAKCDYCGATYPKTENKCPGCGARNKTLLQKQNNSKIKN